MTPAKRFFSLLRLNKRDIYQIFFYAVFAGIISLSLPLGIQAIINFIQSGRVSASWILLVFIVVAGVAFVGLMAIMQLRITENLQQKIFVRSSFEFAYRLPKIRFDELYNNIYPPELANRFFDTITIQKGVSKLLLDFSAALLQIGFGVILLSLYHPFFILFGILLVILLYLIFRFSYAPGLETSLSESKYKYRVADWLQEIARNNSTFRSLINFNYGLEKNDALVSGYLNYREKHFAVIRRQFVQLVIFKIIITAGLLLIGGYLVLGQQMNIGQFVAAEIVILLVINSVEKIILGLETFYDVLTSVEKIGQVADMDIETGTDNGKAMQGNAVINIEAENIRFRYPDSLKDALKDISLKIGSGEKIILQGANGSGKTTLIRILSGLLKPTSGLLHINDDSFRKFDTAQYRSRIGSIIQGETPFEGTILENITFNDPVPDEDLRWALEKVRLGSFIKSLPDGLDTKIFPEGKQLSSSNAQKILLARSIVRKPSVLFFEDPTDRMDNDAATALIDFLFSEDNPWTVVVSSANPHWQARCTRQIIMHNGKIVSDTKK